MKVHFPSGTKIVLGTSVAAILVIALGAFVAKNRQLTGLESSLIQIIQIAITSYTSYVLAKDSAIKNQNKLVSQRVVLSMRRAWRQADSIVKLKDSIEKQRSFLLGSINQRQQVEIRLVENSLDMISDHVSEQGGVVNDIIQDWHELAPDDVDKIEQKIIGKEK